MNSEKPILKAKIDRDLFYLFNRDGEFRWYREDGVKTGIFGMCIAEARRKFAYLGLEEAKRLEAERG